MAIYKTRTGTVRTGSDRTGTRIGSSKSSSSKTSSSKDYTLRPGESVVQWNARTGGNASVVNPTGTAQQTVGKARSMVAQTQAEGSKPFAGSSFETAYKDSVINSDILKPTTAPNIPYMKDTPVPDVVSYNAGLLGGEFGLTQQGNTIVTPTIESVQKEQDTNFQSYIKSLQENDLPSAGDIQRKLEKETQLKQKQQEVNNLSGVLNTIVANRDAAMLALEGQGRGQTEGFIGGEQARINREAAIQALPVQAQLAQAQGNLELAQNHINTWGQILMSDAKNKYEHQNAIYTAIYNYTSDKNKARIDDLKMQNDRKYAENKALIQAKTQALSNALGQGAPSSVQGAIRAASTLEEVVSAAGIYNADILAREAQKANIAQSYASIARDNAELAVIQAKQKQIEDALASGVVQLDSEQQKTAMSLGKQFEDESKNFKIQTNSYNQILASAEDPSAAGDLSLLFGYMKMLDPNSVVRETEFANAENAAGVPERVRAQWNKVVSGQRLSETMRADFIDRAGKIYNSALDQQVDLEDTYRQQGTNVYGLPKEAVDLIVRDIRATGAVSEVVFGLTLNNLSDEQLIDLRQSGLLTTPSSI